MIVQNVSDNNRTVDITFTVPKDELERAISIEKRSFSSEGKRFGGKIKDNFPNSVKDI